MSASGGGMHPPSLPSVQPAPSSHLHSLSRSIRPSPSQFGTQLSPTMWKLPSHTHSFLPFTSLIVYVPSLQTHPPSLPSVQPAPSSHVHSSLWSIRPSPSQFGTQLS